mmetsp:Transcript_28885/g.51663  ORF Transcript_28885/g.51663 Transcript_28885/m.51663 type:complete len:254 (+) Transcript_28885:472-1233(+)
MVGEDAALQASLVRQDGILTTLHALQQHLHLGDALEPRHVVPAKAGVDVGADGTCGALRTVNSTFFLIAVLHIGALLSELAAHILLASAQLRSIHRHEERLDAGSLQLLHVYLRARALRVHVELRKHQLARRPGFQHLVQGVGAERGQHVRHAGLGCGLHDAHLAVLVRELGQGRGREVQGQGGRSPQEAGAHVDVLNIDQDARAHGDSLESQVVVAERDLVISAAGVVAPGLRLHDLPGNRLEIEGVEHEVE